MQHMAVEEGSLAGDLLKEDPEGGSHRRREVDGGVGDGTFEAMLVVGG